jgi:hypothetical protein
LNCRKLIEEDQLIEAGMLIRDFELEEVVLKCLLSEKENIQLMSFKMHPKNGKDDFKLLFLKKNNASVTKGIGSANESELGIKKG